MTHRIGLNAQLLSGATSYRSAGIHHYIDRLLHHLPAAGEGLELVVFANQAAGLVVDGLRTCTSLACASCGSKSPSRPGRCAKG
jgi:hypothetical protein